MRRLVTDALLAWSDSQRRKPLIVRGARQVGKTWAINDLGPSRFATVHAVDLERHREWHRLFDGDLDARRIVADLEVLLDVASRPASTCSSSTRSRPVPEP